MTLFGIRPVRVLLAAAVLAAGGAARLPLESAFSRDLRDRGVLEPPLDLSLRDELGQSFFIAVLGGFRSLIASLIEVRSVDYWQYRDWNRLDAAYALCNRLQPREWHYWDFRAWHSAVNAWDDTRWQDTAPGGRLRPHVLRELTRHGERVLLEARKYLPDRYEVPKALADLISDMFRVPDIDHSRAADLYEEAYRLPGARRYIWRLHVYQLAKAPGRELEAWRKLLELHNSSDPLDRTPSVRTALAVLWPVVRTLDPTATLPEDVARDQERLRAEEAARQAKRDEPVPRVTSPALAPTQER